MSRLIEQLDTDQRRIFDSIKSHAEQLLGQSPRFPYFTLHGKPHIENMLKIADIFLQLGIQLSQEEAYLLCVAICLHDVGMVVPLKESTYQQILQGAPQISDPMIIEAYIREQHHELIREYVEKYFDFLLSLGLTPHQCGVLKSIARTHRKVKLSELSGRVRKLGALLRVIDELDIGPERAPASLLRNNYKEMDSTSCWHWFKHNIVHPWDIGDNIKQIIEHDLKTIVFQLVVTPPKEESISYWIHQIKRPIMNVLRDEGAASAILEFWHMRIEIEASLKRSRPNPLGDEWEQIEQKALSHGRKVILLIDDEVRKMTDLLRPLMDDFHIVFAPNARDALNKLRAVEVDLAIVDMQIGSGDLWTREETEDYKATGKKLCEEILKISPNTKLAILTGTRYEMQSIEEFPLAFLMKKPVDPELFEREIYNVLK